MKLNDQEKRVLAAVELAADKTVPEIAKETRMQAASVQRSLSNLISHRIIDGRTTIIDLAKLGFIEHGLFVSLNANVAQLEAFMKELQKHPQVSWIAEGGAKYDLMFNLVVQNSREAMNFLDRLTIRFPEIIREKEILIRMERLRYWRRYLSGNIRKRPQFIIGADAKQVEIDSRDRQVLLALSQTKLESFRELALTCEMPISSFLRRLQKLKESNLVLGFGYRLNLEMLGVQQYRVLIATADQSAAYKSLKLYCEETGKIKLLTRCLGRYDFDLEIDIPMADDIRQVIGDLKNILHQFKPEIQIVPIFKHRKFIAFPVS